MIYEGMFHNYSDPKQPQGLMVTDDAMSQIMAMNPTIKPVCLNGVHFVFPNGITVSIQWGPGTYSDNHGDVFDYRKQEPEHRMHSNTAEVFIWITDDNPQYSHRMRDENHMPITGMFADCEIQDPAGWQTMEEVQAILLKAGAWQDTPENRAAIYELIRVRKERWD